MKAAKRQALVSVKGISGYFAVKTGGATDSAISNAWDGGALRPTKLAAPALVEDITLERPFDPDRDGPLLADLRQKCGRWRTTISISYTDQDFIRVGDPEVYPNSLLSRVNDPDVDAGSGEPMTLSLVFSPDDAI